jgi:hypothetical protein
MKIKEVAYTENYIMVKIDTSDTQMPTLNDMEQWCTATQSGKRVGMRNFAFKTEAEFLMFKLKWL